MISFVTTHICKQATEFASIRMPTLRALSSWFTMRRSMSGHIWLVQLCLYAWFPMCLSIYSPQACMEIRLAWPSDGLRTLMWVDSMTFTVIERNGTSLRMTSAPTRRQKCLMICLKPISCLIGTIKRELTKSLIWVTLISTTMQKLSSKLITT